VFAYESVEPDGAQLLGPPALAPGPA
jgi:hypothetical protein